MTKKHKKKKFRQSIRPHFNIHTITVDIEKRDKERDKPILLSKNVEVICLGCGYRFYVAFYTLNGVRCPLCRCRFRPNWMGTNIRDSTLTDKELRIEGEYRIGGIKLRRKRRRDLGRDIIRS